MNTADGNSPAARSEKMFFLAHPCGTYIFELKVNKPPKVAMSQIQRRKYAEPYRAAGGARAVVTARALDNTPDYMVVDISAADAATENGTAVVGLYAPNDWGLYDMAAMCLNGVSTGMQTTSKNSTER